MKINPRGTSAKERPRAIASAVRRAIKRERERCLKIVETEEEAEGEPTSEVIEAMMAAGPIVNTRASIRATKKSIAKRIRSTC